VRARDVVLATNAYANPLGLLHHRVMPFHVYNIVTEPLSDARMAEFGWPGRENVYNARTLFWTMRPTADNRLLFIENDALYFRDIHRDHSHRPSEYRSHHRKLLELFPFMKEVRITHQWGGRIGMTLDSLPSIGRTARHGNVYYGMGYNGHGLAFAQLAGKMIAALMAEERSELTDHALIGRRLKGVPSASLAYLGINAYKLYYKLLDRWLAGGG
jgi:glycine/D-amino acid oxidase-like deaminating enzyme